MKTSTFCRLAHLVRGGLWGLALWLWLAASPVQAASRLQALDYAQLPGDRLEFVLRLDGPTMTPRDFQTENPDRIVLDLPGVSNGLDRKTLPVRQSGVSSVQTLAAGGRTRVVFNLDAMQAYTVRAEGNRVILTLQGQAVRRSSGAPSIRSNLAPPPNAGRYPPVSARPPVSQYSGYARTRELGNIDFRRGEKGEGRLLITLGDPKALADIRREGRKVVIRLNDAILPARLSRRLDVIDFATPVHYIEATAETGGAKIVVTPVSDEYEYSSYQIGGLLAVDFRGITEQQQMLNARDKPIVYSGDKLTLDFQDIPVRQVLSILSDFTHINIVASDTVDGRVTLRLQEVPWDQALDLVLQAKGLGRRQVGNIMRVAPLDELAKEQQGELEANRVVEELEPLRTEIIQIKYTKAEDIKNIMYGTVTKAEVTKDYTDISTFGAGYYGSRSSAYGGGGFRPSQRSEKTSSAGESIMSERGKITTDPRTNQLIVMDTASNIERIRELVSRLDTPVRQVLIESRVVIATNDFTRELGAKVNFNRVTVDGNTITESKTDKYTPNDINGNALIDLASAAAAASGGYFGMTFIKIGNYVLDLELSAAQIEGRTEIISTPKVLTTDGAEAFILQGTQIPYTNAAPGAIATMTVFKNAVLELKVTPHITADENILMDLSIKKDAPGAPTPNGLAIDTKQIVTTAQVSNGETIVLWAACTRGISRTRQRKCRFWAICRASASCSGAIRSRTTKRNC